MEHIKLRPDGDVVYMIFDRPRQRNALTNEMWRAIPDMLDRLNEDGRVKVLVLRGVDERAFSAGADIAEFTAAFGSPDSALQSSSYPQKAQSRLAAFSKPTIAMIQGVCVGGGCGLALACDFRFADETARFGITPARLGITYSIADTRRLVSVVGTAHAKDLLFSARILDARQALAIGLVNTLAKTNELAVDVEAYARLLAGNSQASIRASKAIFGRIEAGAADNDSDAARIFQDLFSGPDRAEGVSAFLAKRPPAFPTR